VINVLGVEVANEDPDSVVVVAVSSVVDIRSVEVSVVTTSLSVVYISVVASVVAVSVAVVSVAFPYPGNSESSRSNKAAHSSSSASSMSGSTSLVRASSGITALGVSIAPPAQINSEIVTVAVA
jgi:hypothetical protein